MNAPASVENRGADKPLSALDRLAGEQWLARRLLKLLKVDVLRGCSISSEERKQRFREAITFHGLALEPIAHTAGRKSILAGEAFERIYGERL